MDQLTPDREAAIWQRVAAGTTEDTSRVCQQPLLPELRDLLERVALQQKRYHRLYEKNPRQAAYKSLFLQTKRQLAVLSGLYLYLSGEKPARETPVLSPFPSLRELLIALMKAEELSADRMLALSQRAGGEVSVALERESQAVRERFHTLVEILGEVG